MEDLENLSREEIETQWHAAADAEAIAAQEVFCHLHPEFLDEGNAFALIQVLIRQARQAGEEPAITWESLERAFGELAQPDMTDEYMVSGINGDPRLRVSLDHIKKLAEQSA